MNLIPIILIAVLSLTLFSITPAYAAVTVQWLTGGGDSGSTVAMSAGDVFSASDNPVTLHIVDSSLNGNGGALDTIQVTIQSAKETITLSLKETSDNGVFDSGTIIFMDSQNAKMALTDTATLTIEDPTYKNNGNSGEVLSSSGSSDGLLVGSESDTTGISLDVVEDGDTGIFKTTLHFCSTSSCSSASTKTLEAKASDTITVYDYKTSVENNGVITPLTSKEGAIITSAGDTLTASYGGSSDNLQVTGTNTGRGSGGLLRPGLVVDAIISTLSTIVGGSGCIGDCVPPTLGIGQNNDRIVTNGFTYNGKPIDVEKYYTPYPLITVQTGVPNTAVFKIYENMGTENIAHFDFAFGLAKGQILQDSKARVEWNNNYGKETVNLVDPENVLTDVSITHKKVPCNGTDATECLAITIRHTFKAPLEFDIVATNVWDQYKNAWQNYYNHGIHISGDSLNPPKEYDGIFKGHIFHLTETGKHSAVDDMGNSWHYNKTWIRDFILVKKPDKDIRNPDKIWAIKHLGFSDTDGDNIFGYARSDHRFSGVIAAQQMLVEKTISDMCNKCMDPTFEEIDRIFTYDFPKRHMKLDDPEVISQMNSEDMRARAYLDDYFRTIYPSK